jgi:predicted transcriptional regulator of viral defense system
LATVLQAAQDLVTINDVRAALGVDCLQAAKPLARGQQQGWLKRVGWGLYTPIPLNAISTEQCSLPP